MKHRPGRAVPRRGIEATTENSHTYTANAGGLAFIAQPNRH